MRGSQNNTVVMVYDAATATDSGGFVATTYTSRGYFVPAYSENLSLTDSLVTQWGIDAQNANAMFFRLPLDKTIAIGDGIYDSTGKYIVKNVSHYSQGLSGTTELQTIYRPDAF